MDHCCIRCVRPLLIVSALLSTNISAYGKFAKGNCTTIHYSHIKVFMPYCILSTLAVTLEPANEPLALCVDSSLVISCTTTSDLVWRLIPNQGNLNSFAPKVYTSSSSLGDVGMIDDFVLRLESKNPLVSTATLDRVYLKHNGSVLMCAISQFPDSDEFANVTIIVKGIKQQATTISLEHVRFRSALLLSRSSLCSAVSRVLPSVAHFSSSVMDSSH